MARYYLVLLLCLIPRGMRCHHAQAAQAAQAPVSAPSRSTWANFTVPNAPSPSNAPNLMAPLSMTGTPSILRRSSTSCCGQRHPKRKQRVRPSFRHLHSPWPASLLAWHVSLCSHGMCQTSFYRPSTMPLRVLCVRCTPECERQRPPPKMAECPPPRPPRPPSPQLPR